MPRNRIFQIQSGCAIDGYAAENWLIENPFTPEVEGSIHYRFYIMNLENISSGEPLSLPTLLPYILVGTAIVGIVTLVIIRFKKRA